jgi:DNA-binding response OmpR family regulator
LLKNRILIVDDEPDIAQVLKMGLEDNGFAVDAYNDPLDAISNFEVGSYDLLLIDIKMPKMNGFELLLQEKLSLQREFSSLHSSTHFSNKDKIPFLHMSIQFN